MTALLRGDIDHGYLLAHKALEEDVLTTGERRPDLSPYALVSLNYQKENRAFRHWVQEQAAFLNEFIADYANINQRVLTIDDVRQRFINSPPNRDTVFLLTYTVARLRKIVGISVQTTSNDFAGQIELNLLFDVTLVIDLVIRAKTPAQWKFIDHAVYLLDAAGHRLAKNQLGEVNGIFEKGFDAGLE